MYATALSPKQLLVFIDQADQSPLWEYFIVSELPSTAVTRTHAKEAEELVIVSREEHAGLGLLISKRKQCL